MPITTKAVPTKKGTLQPQASTASGPSIIVLMYKVSTAKKGPIAHPLPTKLV